MTLIIPNHRKRSTLTLSREYKGKTIELTVRTHGKRTIELGADVCATYAECIDAMVTRGDLLVP